MSKGYFVPRVCDEGALVYCRGCDFKEEIEKIWKPWGLEVICQKDVLENMEEELKPVISELRENKSALLPVELAVKNSWNLKRELELKPIKPFELKKFSSFGKPNIRVSDLTAPCPFGVLANRYAEKPAWVLERAGFGTKYHEFSLADPPLSENQVYLPWFFLDSQNYSPRSEYCEVKLFSNLDGFEEQIEMSGHPDAVFQLGEEGLVADFKFTRAPPYYPYKGHSRQLAGYAMLIEALTGVPVRKGLVIYAKKLGGRFSPRPVDISEASRTREEAKDFIRKTISVFNGESTAKDFRKERCEKCYNWDYCSKQD